MLVEFSFSNSFSLNLLYPCPQLSHFPLPDIIWLFQAIESDVYMDKWGGETLVKRVLQMIPPIPVGVIGLH